MATNPPSEFWRRRCSRSFTYITNVPVGVELPPRSHASMTGSTLHKLDLNLLHVFLAVYEERSVASAAGRLSVSPSAISHSLRRLRSHFQDELFVWNGIDDAADAAQRRT